MGQNPRNYVLQLLQFVGVAFLNHFSSQQQKQHHTLCRLLSTSIGINPHSLSHTTSYTNNALFLSANCLDPFETERTCRRSSRTNEDEDEDENENDDTPQ